MSVDWLTVAAQVVNFLVLVWLLQRFLYGPITQAMERREQSIAQRLAEASEKRRLAEYESQELQAARRALADRREAVLAEARNEATVLRSQLENDARAEMEMLRLEWSQQIEEEREAYIAHLRQCTAEHFHALAREALGGLAKKTLSDAIADGFSDQLRGMEPERRGLLRTAARAAHFHAIVETSFPPSVSIKQRVTAAVREQIDGQTDVEYATAQDMICGVRLRIAGQSISWSLDSYLDRMEQRVRDEMMDHDAAPHGTLRR